MATHLQPVSSPGAQAAARDAPQGLADEYTDMNSQGETAVVENFELERGRVLKHTETRYNTWGKLNEQADNVLVICHALTGNSNVQAWWAALLGPGRPFDTQKYFVFCANVLGGCYGSTGPSSVNPDTGEKWGMDFPVVTIRDMVRLQEEVLLQLGVKGVTAAIGGSMGGMQALEWGMAVKRLGARAIMSFSSSGRHQPWQIGISECQRQAIYADPAWKGGAYKMDEPPVKGVAVARMMAMVTYRTHPGYWTKFGRSTTDRCGASSTSPSRARSSSDAGDDHKHTVYEVECYLRYQGDNFHKRGFDAASYVRLTQAMDSHDMARGRGDYFEVLRRISVPTLVVSISSDVLYPISEQLELAEHMPNAQHHMIQSDEGHDGFLLESRKLGVLVRGFLGMLESEGQGHV